MPPKDISLSTEERRAFDRLFENADTEQLGVLTGDKAVPFFEASELPGQVLGEIWALADDENTGFLTKEAFYVVCRLIGYAQRGQQPSQALMKKSGPLPFFKGMHVPGLPEQPPSATRMGTPQKKVPAHTPSMSITPEDKGKYTRLFFNSQPVGGLLDGEKAREIFTKSRLPNEKLGQIWNLADTQGRGALDATDFVIAMHLIHGSMNGTIPQLPETLPVSLYAQAAAGSASGIPSMPISPIGAQNTGSPMPATLYSQPTGSSLLNRTSAGGGPLSPAQRGMSLGQSQNGGIWAIDAAEKAQSDQFFDMLDTSRQGILQGDIAVPFFVQSGLPEETLAQIWDLSDIRKEGTLTKEEFAVARRLVMDVLAGKPLPDQLDQSMIPPHLRAIAQQMQNQPQQSEVQRDLFSLMDDDEPSQLPPAAIASGASAFQPLPASARVASPGPIQPTPTGGSGRSLPPASQPIRSGTASRQDSNHHRSPPPPVPAHRTPSAHTIHPASPAHSATPSHSFFDTTPVEEKGNQLSSNSVEVGNLQNQVRETQKSVSSLRQERTALSNSVAKTEAEIDELKSALAQAKAAYDTESTNMTNLETRSKAGSEELKKLREELIHAESELSALREQKSETEQIILKDKEEIRELKIKLKVSNDEVASLKETLEKLRKESRQQKGLLVVSKKQLATSETDKERASRSIAEEREHAKAMHVPPPSVTEAARAVPLPDSRGASPAASMHSNRSTNPFFAHTSAARVTSPLHASSVPVQDQADSDPFGLATQPVSAPQPIAAARAPGFGFDDDFDSAFNTASIAETSRTLKDEEPEAIGTIDAPQIKGDTDFDAAFADFDKPVPVDHEVESAQTVGDSSAQVANPAAGEQNRADTDADGQQVGKATEQQVTNLTGLAAVGAAVGALAGAGASALTQVTDVLHLNEPSDQSVTSPSSMQPYESRQLPGDVGSDQDDGDEELAPIRDMQPDDSDTDSQSESETDDRATRSAGQHGDDNNGPFASAEDGPDEYASDRVQRQGYDEQPQLESDVQDRPVHTGQSLASDPFPGAFPSSRDSGPPSSVGEADDHFEDAHTEQNERSASPHQEVQAGIFPPSAAETDTSNETEPLKSPSAPGLEGDAITSAGVSKPGPVLGFDDAFDSPFKALTPASHESPAPVKSVEEGFKPEGLASAINEDAAEDVPGQAGTEVPGSLTAHSGDADDIDDFEDLAPARLEETSSSALTSAPNSASKPDFDSNFDDDFGFDNQTFSHSNAQQDATQSKDEGSTGFDDNFDSAFDTPAPAPAPATTQTTDSQPPTLPSRAGAVGFDDDFFSTPTSAQPPNTGQPDLYLQQQYQQPNFSPAASQGKRASYDIPPPGQPPASSQPTQNESAAAFAQPPGPPPQQQPPHASAAPALPARTDADGDLPQVKELVGMGFNRTQAIAALEDNQFDLERAANALLSVNH